VSKNEKLIDDLYLRLPWPPMEKRNKKQYDDRNENKD
jgi:hypothetical protein